MSPPIETEVWLIEDHQVYRETIAKALGKIPHVRCARSCANSEEAIVALKNGFVANVILLDLGLPGLGGLEAIPLIKHLSPSTAIVVLTAFDNHDKIFQAICAGASGYLLKTAPISQIGKAIHEVLNGGAPLTPQVATSVLKMFSSMAPPKKKDYGLSKREEEVLELMVKGLLLKQIAGELNLSYHTVDTHLRNIYGKLHVQSRSGAIAKAMQERLL